MNHRERALAALNHREGDRVPIDLAATRNTGILLEAYQALARRLGADRDPPADDFGQSRIARVASPEEWLLERLDVDFRGIYLGSPDRRLDRLLPDGSYQDELGVIRRRPPSSYYYDITYSPFDRDITLADLRAHPWPDGSDPGYTRWLRDRALALHAAGEYGVVLHLQDIIVHPSQYLRGFERWYTDFILQPELIASLLDILLEIRLAVTVQALRAVGDLVDVVSCSDDVADQRGPQIAPATYRRFIKPRHRRYFDAIRALTSAKILYHSCGSVARLIPDFIDMGVDFINPVQVSAAGMDTAGLKRAFGDNVGFWGSIDTMQVLPFGTPDEVRAEVQHRIRDLAPGGGFVLAAVHNIQPTVPTENIIAMYAAARDFGTYPIRC